MPKMKTKSGAKKRFKFTANGKIKTHQVGKRHRLINNSPARTRDLRGTAVRDGRHIRKPSASSAGSPYGRPGSDPCLRRAPVPYPAMRAARRS